METIKIIIWIWLIICLNSYFISISYREKIKDLELTIKSLKLEKHKFENKASYYKNKNKVWE